MGYDNIHKEIKQLDISERILLAEEIWDSIAAEQEQIKMTQAQKDEIDKRIDAYKKSPSEGSTWEEVKKRIKSKK